MAVVDVKLLGPEVDGHSVTVLHSSNKPSELWQWLCHDDSTINIAVSITIIILLYYYYSVTFITMHRGLCVDISLCSCFLLLLHL